MELERFVTETGRPLPIFLLLDCSGSMSGEKINTLNQAVKALAIARGFLTPSGIEICITPSFKEILIEGKTKTAIKLKVEKK